MRLATNQNPFQLSEPLNIIHRAWRLAVGATPIPQRHRLDPRDLKQHVERTFILEQKSTDDFRIRLAGQAVCNQIGMEIRGMPAVSMFALDDRQALTTLLCDICQDHMIAQLSVLGTSCGTTGSIILLPMEDHEGSVVRILGGVDIQSQAMPPNRFAISKITTASIATLPELEPDPDDTAPENAQAFQVVYGGRSAGAPKTRRRGSLSLVR